MKFLYSLILLMNIFYMDGVFVSPEHGRYFTMYGQIIYPYGSQISIEPNCQLIVELHDISVTDQFSRKIAQHKREAVVFPVIFSISYQPSDIIHEHLHVLNVRIVNKNDEVLFVNEHRIEVKLLGLGRTTFIDIPVIRVTHQDAAPYFKSREWPELIGAKGNEAVDIIKQQTGYEKVFVVTNHTQVSKDIRYNRVCIYVDNEGKVAHVPRTG